MKPHPLLTRDVILVIVISVLLLGYGGYMVFPQIAKIGESASQLTGLQPQIDALKAQIEANKAKAAADQAKADALPVEIYTSPYPGLSLDTAAAGILDEVVTMIKGLKIEVQQVSYEPTDKTFLTLTVPTGYDAVSLNFKLRTSYKSFRDLLFKMYGNKYLIGIKHIKIDKISGDTGKLDAELNIILYIKTT